MIDIQKARKNIETFTDLFVNGLPEGYLYNGNNIRKLCSGFLETYQDYYKTLEQGINDIFDVNKTSLYLEEYKTMYGLPNVLFPEINTNEDAVFAISMMKTSQNLFSKEDFESFLLLLGYNVKFYKINNVVLNNLGFNYGFPASFSYGVNSKNKYKYLIYVEEGSPSIPVGIRNIGNSFPIQFIQSQNNRQKVKIILDYLKPDYLIFQYITLSTKNLYGF